MTRRVATTVLLGILLAMFALEVARGAVGDEVALLRMGALPNDGALGGEYWRLVTYSLLHLNPMHILMNAALLWWVGYVVERRIPRAAFAAVYAGASLASGAMITVARMAHPRAGASLGASGGLFGLVGCALVLSYRRDAAAFGQGRSLRMALWAVAIVGLAASLIQGVSLSGHGGGLAAGLLAGFLVPVRAPGIENSDPS